MTLASYTGSKEFRVKAGGYEIFTRRWPGPEKRDIPVILVHGLVISSRYMIPLAERLSPHFKVYAPDLPGYGESEKLDRALRVPELADVLHAWMQALEISTGFLIGNSYGCNVIAELAVRHPKDVRKAVLQGPTADVKARTFPKQIARLIRNSPNERSNLGSLMARDYAAAGWRVAKETVQAGIHDPIEKKLPRVRVPVLLVRGSKDPVCPQEWMDQLIALLPKGSLKVVPGGTHTLNFIAPLEFARVTIPFLESA